MKTDLKDKTGSRYAVLVDFGSTYTKMAVADRTEHRIVTTAHFPSTVSTDASIALSECYDAAKESIGPEEFQRASKIASSSAAGGLRMAVTGLSRSLSIQAGRSAAFGAGAKILRTCSGLLNDTDIAELTSLPIEILLVTGGYDHGNRTTLLANCEKIAASPLHVPIVFAGNCDVAQDVRRMLTFAGKEFYIVPNILPAVGKVNSKPVEEIIRNLFLSRIVNMKGLDKVTGLLDEVVMPTPKAVLSACELLSLGPGGKGGLGEIIVVDVGGATTDIHSCAEPKAYEGAKLLGAGNAYTQRTVEGDLGMRESSDTLLAEAGPFGKEIQTVIDRWHESHEALPENDLEAEVDHYLAKNAVRISARRHAGRVEPTVGSTIRYVQYGKDLTGVRTVIGTGGPLVFSGYGKELLAEVLRDPDREPEILLPSEARFLLDEDYIFFAAGLLREIDEEAAFGLMCNSLRI